MGTKLARQPGLSPGPGRAPARLSEHRLPEQPARHHPPTLDRGPPPPRPPRLRIADPDHLFNGDPLARSAGACKRARADPLRSAV
jgi:hypothetical protein